MKTSQEIEKHKKGQCSVPYCTKKHVKGLYLCHKHRMDRFKQNNPVKYAYMVHKNNAKRRGKEHSLTIEEFEQFATVQTVYLADRGISKQGLHIDRIDPNQGYHIWNIQAITNTENAKKRFTDQAPF
jgi:hypothetical protein